MDYFISPELWLELFYAEERQADRQNAFAAEALQATEPRPGVRHTLAAALRGLAARIDDPAAAADMSRIVAQS